MAQYERHRAPPGTAHKNPYLGLAAFQLEDAHLFFGRETLISNLWQRFEGLCEKPDATRLLAILGPSGSGKSSVARAGLLAALMHSPLPGPQPSRIAILKPGDRPIESLARALVPLLPTDNAVLPANRAISVEDLLRHPQVPGEGLRRFAADLPEHTQRPVLVLVDQFEEIYTLCSNASERDLFVSLLLQAAQSPFGHVSVVLTLRSDFLGETQRHHNQLNRLIAEQSVIVPALSSDELRDVIARPAERAGRPLDETTVELLLAEARGSQGALPLLEFALTRIWEDMANGAEPGATLRRIGGVGGALAEEAQKIFNSLSEAERTTARRALVRLVQLGEGTRDTRRRLAIRDLCGRGETGETVLAVLRQFATENARLVTLSGAGDQAVAEVTHEALFEHFTELRKWLNESRADRRFHDRVADAARLWDEANRPSGRLWRLPDVDLLRDYKRRNPDELSPLQEQFLGAAVNRQRLEKWILLAVAMAVLSAMLWGAFYAATYLLTYRGAAKRVDAHFSRGKGLLELARQKEAEVKALRQSALSAFDSQQKEQGNKLWNRMLIVASEAEERYGRASQALEAALNVDPSRHDVRELLADSCSKPLSALSVTSTAPSATTWYSA